jgi:hypothetical protein
MESITTPPAAEWAIYQASAEAVTTIKNRLHAAGLHLQHHESLALALLIRDSIRDCIAATGQEVADASLRTHAEILNLSPEQLSAALFQYAARELAEWVTMQEEGDPGGEWIPGECAPDWLRPYIDSLPCRMATAATAQEVA